MRLELAEFPIKDVRFGKQTGYSNGVLEIDKEKLVELVLQDNKIVAADLDVASPNEQTRIVNIRDVVEPRVKISGPGCVFPGIMGPVETVGEGRTHRLSGVTVMSAAEYRPTILSGTGSQISAILDMWGPGAVVTPFASMINVVLILKLIDGVSEWEAHATIQSAEFKVANRLAEATRDKTPENVEVFELSEVDPSLPRVVYILSCNTRQAPHSGAAYYGLPIRETPPTFIHPNEFLDGALTADARQGSAARIQTWGWMNQPVVLRLLREHGKRLNFVGVILERTGFQTELDKQITATTTSQMARLLGADSALMTRTGISGNTFIEVMLTVQACVRKGVKTVLMIPEWGGTEGVDLPLLFHVPEANAMVSTGSFEREIKLPTPSKVIGVKRGQLVCIMPGDPPFSPWSELTRDGWRDIAGGIDWFGGMNLTCEEY